MISANGEKYPYPDNTGKDHVLLSTFMKGEKMGYPKFFRVSQSFLGSNFRVCI